MSPTPPTPCVPLPAGREAACAAVAAAAHRAFNTRLTSDIAAASLRVPQYKLHPPYVAAVLPPPAHLCLSPNAQRKVASGELGELGELGYMAPCQETHHQVLYKAMQYGIMPGAHH